MGIFMLIFLLVAHLGLGASSVTTLTSNLTDRNLDHILCRDITFYKHANLGTINEGIDYLRAHDPQDRWICHQAGGGCCSRVACEYSAAIYVCNDSEDEDVQVNLSAVADLAQAITEQDRCVWRPSTGHVVLGQAFDDGGWNVIVGIKGGDWC